MSVLVALGAVAVDALFGDYPIIGTLPPLTLFVATIISFGVGYLTMDLLLRVAKKIQFGYFCIFYGIIAFVVILPFMFL